MVTRSVLSSSSEKKLAVLVDTDALLNFEFGAFPMVGWVPCITPMALPAVADVRDLVSNLPSLYAGGWAGCLFWKKSDGVVSNWAGQMGAHLGRSWLRVRWLVARCGCTLRRIVTNKFWNNQPDTHLRIRQLRDFVTRVYVAVCCVLWIFRLPVCHRRSRWSRKHIPWNERLCHHCAPCPSWYCRRGRNLNWVLYNHQKPHLSLSWDTVAVYPNWEQW